MAASQVSGMVIVLLVHSIFIYRIWILSRRERIAIILPSVLVLVNTGFESVLCFSLFNDDTWTALHSQARSSMAINAAASLNVAVDVVVTATLIYYLRKGRGSGQRADRLIARLQAYIINSGAITAAASVSVLLTFIVADDSLLYAGLVQTVIKLYNNALLASLNARDPRGEICEVESSTSSSAYQQPYPGTLMGRIFHAAWPAKTTHRIVMRDDSTQSKLGTMQFAPESESCIEIT